MKLKVPVPELLVWPMFVVVVNSHAYVTPVAGVPVNDTDTWSPWSFVTLPGWFTVTASGFVIVTGVALLIQPLPSLTFTW